MPERLPEVVDPIAFAEKRRRLVGSIPLSRLDRLEGVVLDPSGQVEVELVFSKSGRIPIVEGTVEAELTLQCQCCLGPINWPVSSHLSLGIVSSVDAAVALPDALEALLVDPGAEVAIADIVQDELLLAIPAVPQHPNCRLPKAADPTPERLNPFADLARLKTKSSS